MAKFYINKIDPVKYDKPDDGKVMIKVSGSGTPKDSAAPVQPSTFSSAAPYSSVAANVSSCPLTLALRRRIACDSRSHTSLHSQS